MYFQANIKTLNGNYENNNCIIVLATPDTIESRLDVICKDWYTGFDFEDDDGYWFDNGSCVSAGSYKLVSAETVKDISPMLTSF